MYLLEWVKESMVMGQGDSARSVGGETHHSIIYHAAAAIAVSGHIATRDSIDVLIDGDIRAQVKPAADGAYSALSQIPPPTKTPVRVVLAAQADGKSATRTISVSLPDATPGDHMSLIDGGGWRVDATLPGGGVQTTLVF